MCFCYAGAVATKRLRATTSSFPTSTWTWWTARCLVTAARRVTFPGRRSAPTATSSVSLSIPTTSTTPPASRRSTSSAELTKVQKRSVNSRIRIFTAQRICIMQRVCIARCMLSSNGCAAVQWRRHDLVRGAQNDMKIICLIYRVTR